MVRRTGDERKRGRDREDERAREKERYREREREGREREKDNRCARTAVAAAGVRRSRANPFKSTQLRQWGFICYLGGHIVSRRERTDRLRRASDGAGPREPAPTEDAAPRERLYLPRVPPFRFPPSLPPPLLFYGRHPTPRLVDVAAIRQKSGFAVTRPRRNFPRIAHTSRPVSRIPSRP